MTKIFKKLLLKKETPFLSKIVHFRHKIAWISERKVHSQNPRDTCLIICHKGDTYCSFSQIQDPWSSPCKYCKKFLITIRQRTKVNLSNSNRFLKSAKILHQGNDKSLSNSTAITFEKPTQRVSEPLDFSSLTQLFSDAPVEKISDPRRDSPPQSHKSARDWHCRYCVLPKFYVRPLRLHIILRMLARVRCGLA